MIYNLTPEQITEVKNYFTGWQEINERAKELREEKADICAKASEVLDCKKSQANKVFKALQELWDGQEAEVNEIASVLENIQANGSDDDSGTN